VLIRKAVALATAAVALYVVLLTGQRALDAYRANRGLDELRREISGLRDRNLALQAELASPRLEEDVERTVREELGYTRPGDRPVILIWPGGEPPPQAPLKPASETRDADWAAWLRSIVGPRASP
jgi:hypothetical protein